MTHIPNPPTGWRFPWPGEVRAPLPDALVPKREAEATPQPGRRRPNIVTTVWSCRHYTRLPAAGHPTRCPECERIAFHLEPPA